MNAIDPKQYAAHTLLTEKQVADWMDCSARSARSWLARHKIKPADAPGRTKRLPRRATCERLSNARVRGNEAHVTHKHQNGRGSLWVDRIFRDVGRIRRATGTNDKDVFKAIDTMLTQLYQQGRFDLLESLRDKKLSLMEVYADWRVKGVERLPSAATLGPVIPRWEKWTATLEAEHRRVAAGWGKKVIGKHLPDGAAIRALPDAVRAIQHTFAAQPRSANLMRSFVLAFLRDTVGRGSPVYSEVVSLRPVKQPRRTPRAKPTLDDVRTMADVLDAQHAPIVWTLALTGMRPKELWVTPWKVMADRVRIEGSKSAGSFRDVPLLGVITKPAVAHVTFRKAFKAKYRRVAGLRPAPRLRGPSGGCWRAAHAQVALHGARPEGRSRPVRVPRSECIPERRRGADNGPPGPARWHPPNAQSPGEKMRQSPHISPHRGRHAETVCCAATRWATSTPEEGLEPPTR